MTIELILNSFAILFYITTRADMKKNKMKEDKNNIFNIDKLSKLNKHIIHVSAYILHAKYPFVLNMSTVNLTNEL